MPCYHKFIEDLNLENLNFVPTTLIVGTFNPEWPANNYAEWFYGRTHDEHGNRNNNFWDVLPRLFENEPSLINSGPHQWKEFCSRKKIALTDLIRCIEDADPNDPNHVQYLGGYADDIIANNFHQHLFTDIIYLLQNKPSIKKVYITNGVNGVFWNNIWSPVEEYCLANHIVCGRLLTPSKNARFSMFAHNRRYPNNQFNMNNLNDYILMKWMEVWNNN